ncbi:hypothetical protein ETAA8_23600 [Anatilimnocola aggregata]|uniref:Secretin/TonB short N-terminal domain-containing protein n=1 Tax=Anatilimnocola aggregata TaxID=2528021 RepID=A0A517YAL5_9BACT|nr:hypothetical protein [Anatilimnocola aggregata]QDU27273.1 hypothetical protein ETAA8_23600 [Anatilimnocola aggregata]
MPNLFRWCFARSVLVLLFVGYSSADAQVSLSATADSDATAEEKIEAILLTKISLAFKETPLSDVMTAVSEKSGIQIILSKKIEDAGVQPDQPVTIALKDVSIQSFLNLTLRNLNLTFMVRDEVLVITTVEETQSPENMTTRVYPIKDLLDAKTHDYDALIDLITSTIEPDSWQDVGGPGSISAFENSCCLVFSQRRDIHQRVAALLTTLRKAKTVQGIAPAAPVPSKASTGLPSTTGRNSGFLLPTTSAAKE